MDTQPTFHLRIFDVIKGLLSEKLRATGAFKATSITNRCSPQLLIMTWPSQRTDTWPHSYTTYNTLGKTFMRSPELFNSWTTNLYCCGPIYRCTYPCRNCSNGHPKTREVNMVWDELSWNSSREKSYAPLSKLNSPCYSTPEGWAV